MLSSRIESSLAARRTSACQPFVERCGPQSVVVHRPEIDDLLAVPIVNAGHGVRWTTMPQGVGPTHAERERPNPLKHKHGAFHKPFVASRNVDLHHAAPGPNPALQKRADMD